MSLSKRIARGIAIAAIAAMPITAVIPMQTAQASWLGLALGVGLSYANIENAISTLNDSEEGRSAYFQQIEKNDGVSDDPELNERLTNMMTRLTEAIGKIDPTIYDKPYNYFVNPKTSFNAYCTLGHTISVNAGAFDMVATDDELAVIVGHEIGHGQKKHVESGMRNTLTSSALASAVSEALGGGMAGTAATVVANYVNKVHMTKPQEREADNLAWDYIEQSDFNLGATAGIWQRVLEKNGTGYEGDLFSPSDHPSHQERRDNYAKKLKEYSNDHVSVADGMVKVNGKDFYKPAATDSMSSEERAYYMAGNMVRVFHNNSTVPEAYVDGNTVYMGSKAIVTATNNDSSAEDIAAKLNSLL